MEELIPNTVKYSIGILEFGITFTIFMAVLVLAICVAYDMDRSSLKYCSKSTERSKISEARSEENIQRNKEFEVIQEEHRDLSREISTKIDKLKEKIWKK